MSDRLAAFLELRPVLFGLAYRMLGTTTDADDVVQDAFVRWQAQDAVEVESPRAYLTTVVTRLCIDRLTAARARRESYPGTWLPEPVPVGDSDPAAVAEMADSLSLAFLVLLEELDPLSRAVFLLHDVFGYGFPEVSEMTGESPANCRQLASRARRRVAERRRRFDADVQQSYELARRFVDACGSGDLGGLMTLLAEDVVVWTDGGGKARAAPRPVLGAHRASRFLVGIAKSLSPQSGVELRLLNRQPGVVISDGGIATAAVVLDVSEGRIVGVRVVSNPDKLGAVQPGAWGSRAVP